MTVVLSRSAAAAARGETRPHRAFGPPAPRHRYGSSVAASRARMPERAGAAKPARTANRPFRTEMTDDETRC